MSNLKKQSWPWLGKQEPQFTPEDSYKAIIQDSSEPYDALAPEKSIAGSEPTDYQGGIISPVEGIDQEVSLASDTLAQVNLEVKKEDDSPLARFCCDLAVSIPEKVIGLQSYTNLNESAGLLFKYSNPEDVIYHMGTVQFPIDIIFIDPDSKIKKIYKNIKPGSLSTFGCAQVKNVLEICGGLTDRLGIQEGHKISLSKNQDDLINKVNSSAKTLGIEKNAILKYSEVESNKISNWNGFPIITLNQNSFMKTAHEITSSIMIKLTKAFPPQNFNIQAFDFDSLIDANCKIKVFKTTYTDNHSLPILSLNKKIAFIQIHNEDYVSEVSFKNLLTKKLATDESILTGNTRSLENLFSKPSEQKEALNLFELMIRASRSAKTKPVIVTRYENPELVKSIICAKLGIFYGEDLSSKVASLKLTENSDHYDVISQVKSKYQTNNIDLFTSNEILKRAGVPIPDNIKELAKKAYKILDSVSDVIEKSLENIQNNLQEYEKIRDKTDLVTNSKGQYNQSIKSNTRIVRDFLIKIRDSVKVLNEIKDASTTTEVIDALAESAKTASDSVEKIFDLIEQLDSPEFFNLLSEATTEYEKSIEDLQSSVDKAKDYINSEILGLLIISD